LQRVGQERDGVEPRRARSVPLKFADRLGADASALRQGLLREPSRQARLPKPRAELARSRFDHAPASGSPVSHCALPHRAHLTRPGNRPKCPTNGESASCSLGRAGSKLDARRQKEERDRDRLEKSKHPPDASPRNCSPRGDLRVADELFTPACGHHAPRSTGAGAGEMKHWVAALRRAFPDLRAIVEDQIAQGDRAALRLSLHGTHENGRRATWTVIEFLRVDPDGRFAEHWCVWDELGLRQQLGGDMAGGA
jgi:hypothetical protein